MDGVPSTDTEGVGNPGNAGPLRKRATLCRRAQAVRPDFQVTKANASAVAQLCYRLDGIPLALELAAAQVQTPAQMVSHLEQRLDFFTSRQPNVNPRHRTLRAAIDWSYRLLSLALQRFLTRLAIFRDGWTLEAAEAVCNSAGSALDYLTQLRNCSLVLLDSRAGEMRFRMLETLREYADELLAPEERAYLTQCHAEYYLALAERAEPMLTGPQQRQLLGRLEAEHGNLRAVLQRARDFAQELGLRLAGALYRFWELRGHFAEGRGALEQTLARSNNAPTAARQSLEWRRKTGLGNVT